MSLLNHSHGEKRSAKPTFSLSQMSCDELAQSYPWREKVGKANVLSFFYCLLQIKPAFLVTLQSKDREIDIAHQCLGEG